MSKSRHDKLIDIIIKEHFKNKYHLNDLINTCWEYRLNNGEYGEADLILIDHNGRYAYAIEVKTSDNHRTRKKVYKQLDKDERYIKENFYIDRIFKFYAYYKREKYEIKRIK